MDHGDKETENDDQTKEETQNILRGRTISEGSDNASEESIQGKEKRQCIAIPSIAQHNGYLFPGVPASPPKFVSLDQIMSAADVFSNMALAHEIAVNKDFVLKKNEGHSSIEKQVKEVMHRAFWDVFEGHLNEDPPNYSQALVLLGEIKEILLSILLPHQVRIKSHINEVLDLDLIKQQVDNDALDFQYYTKFILSLMSRLCAPVRDEKMQELNNVKDIVPLYKGILETLDLMRLDMANFTLQQMRPQIQQHSVEYEREKFQEFLNSLKELTPPVDGLELTKQWMHRVYDKLSNPGESETSSSKPSFAEIVTEAYMDIFRWSNDDLFPETLQMDHARFVSLKNQCAQIVLSSSILIVTYSVVGAAIQGISTLKSQLKDQVSVLLEDAASCSVEDLKSKLESIGLQVLKNVNECLEEHGYSTLIPDKETLLLSQITEIHFEDHSVRKLIKRRILEFLEQVLKSPNASSVKIPAGLSAFCKELLTLAGQFLQLVNYNKATFNDIYNDIIETHGKSKDAQHD